MTFVLAAGSGPHTTWYLARASGLTAWLLLLVSVLLGLVMSAKARWKAMPPAWRLDLHRFLGALALGFTLLHIAMLMVDPSVPFRVADVLVPLASRWRPGAVAWGVLGFYLLLAVEVTSLLMRRLPRRWWHRVHLSSLALLAAATVHGIYSGTDAGNRLVQDVLVGAGVVIVPIAAFRIWRINHPSRPARRARAAAPGTADGGATPRGRANAIST